MNLIPELVPLINHYVNVMQQNPFAEIQLFQLIYVVYTEFITIYLLYYLKL